MGACRTPKPVRVVAETQMVVGVDVLEIRKRGEEEARESDEINPPPAPPMPVIGPPVLGSNNPPKTVTDTPPVVAPGRLRENLPAAAGASTAETTGLSEEIAEVKETVGKTPKNKGDGRPIFPQLAVTATAPPPPAHQRVLILPPPTPLFKDAVDSDTHVVVSAAVAPPPPEILPAGERRIFAYRDTSVILTPPVSGKFVRTIDEIVVRISAEKTLVSVSPGVRSKGPFTVKTIPPTPLEALASAPPTPPRFPPPVATLWAAGTLKLRLVSESHRTPPAIIATLPPILTPALEPLAGNRDSPADPNSVTLTEPVSGPLKSKLPFTAGGLGFICSCGTSKLTAVDTPYLTTEFGARAKDPARIIIPLATTCVRPCTPSFPLSCKAEEDIH